MPRGSASPAVALFRDRKQTTKEKGGCAISSNPEGIGFPCAISMKIFNGIFRGFECEFGILDGTSGQMYISLSAKGPNAKKIINKLDEKTLRKTLSLPSNDDDGNNFSFAKFDDAVQWFFMFDRMSSSYSQMYYIWSIGNQVEALYKYGFKEKIIEAKKEK